MTGKSPGEADQTLEAGGPATAKGEKLEALVVRGAGGLLLLLLRPATELSRAKLTNLASGTPPTPTPIRYPKDLQPSQQRGRENGRTAKPVQLVFCKSQMTEHLSLT